MMRKLAGIAALTLALAMLMTGAALAENAGLDRFFDTWVDDGVAVELWQDEDGKLQCHVSLGDGGDESATLDYADCRYDETLDRVFCENGTRTVQSLDAVTGEQKSDVKATDASAEFMFRNGEDALLWNDSEELGVNFTLHRLEDAEAEDAGEAQAFAGRWGCGRATIDIVPRNDDTFDVEITWANSAAEQSVWHYRCAYYGEEKALRTFEPGTLTIVTYSEGGSIADTRVEYEDGQAAFTLDAGGQLHWADARENAGQDMAFIKN